jgi:hypothetical protein
VLIRVLCSHRSPLTVILGGATVLLVGCAGSQFPGSGEPTQYPIASLPLPPYSVREERLPLIGDGPNGPTQAGSGAWASQPPGSTWPPADPADPQAGDGSEAEWLPPPPTFNALAECERAYGPGQCRTGDEIYRQYAPPGTPIPPQIAYGYMPHAYGSMTGVLVNGYLAPPAAYVVGVPYQSYLFPPVISRYRVITPVVIQRYHSAPVYVRETIIHRGPIVRDQRVRPPHPGYPATRPAPGPGASPQWRPDGPPRAAQPLAPPVPPRPIAPIAPPPSPSGSPPASPRPAFRPDAQPPGSLASPPRPSMSPPPAPLSPQAPTLRAPTPPAPGTTSAGPPPPPSQRPPAAASPPALRPPTAPPAGSTPAGPPAPSRQPPPRERKRQDEPPGR